jgi:phospholipid/cholesterol/gamma-HCH transport system permease protein
MSVLERIARATGKPVIAGLRYVQGVVSLSLSATVRLILRRFEPREALRQAFDAGNRSVLFVMLTMSFIGMIMVLEACYQAQRLIGDYSLVGPGFLELLVREFAPTIGAMMIATRVGAGIAAELGSMAVTEQLDALRMCGAEPISELVVPRALACAVMVPALIVLGGFSSELAGLLTARIAFSVPYDAFWNLRLVSMGDVFVGVLKAIVFGWTIPITSSRAGLRARGGSAGVGGATTRAVIDTSLAIIFLDFVLNLALYPIYQRGG